MRKWTWPLLAGIALIFAATQCSQLVTEPEATMSIQQTVDEERTAFNQVQEYGNEIDLFEENALLDSTDENVRRHCFMALIRLDLLLGRVQYIVMHHDNEEAKTLYFDAREVQTNAVEAARIDSFDTAFEYIKESRYLGIEAAKIVIEEARERREEIIERLEDEIDLIEDMLEDIYELLDVNPLPAAARFARRSRDHLARGILKLHAGELRRAGFHLRESKHLAKIALRLLSWSE